MLITFKPLKFPYNPNLSISVSVPADLPEGRSRWAAGRERTDGSRSTFRDRRLDRRRSWSKGFLWSKGLWVFMFVCFDAWANTSLMLLCSPLWSYSVSTWKADIKEHINNVTEDSCYTIKSFYVLNYLLKVHSFNNVKLSKYYLLY